MLTRTPAMSRFQKTRLHVVAAVLILLGLYATAGFLYAAWVHSTDSMTIWLVIAIAAFIGSAVYQRHVVAKRKRAP